MIEPLRHNKEFFPTYEIERPSFCVACLSAKHTKNNPNIAYVFCHECPCMLSGEKEYGALLCKSCDEDKHRSMVTMKHDRQILVIGPGVRKKVIVRGDSVNFPHPLDDVTIQLKARVFNNGVRVRKIPWHTVHFHAGMSGKSLHIQLLGARGLRGRDLTGASDPFVVYSFCGKPITSTRVRPRTRNPRWNNETFIVPLEDQPVPPRDLIPSQKDLIKLEVFDYDWISQNDLLGHIEMTRSKLMKLAVVAQEQVIRIPLTFREHHGILHLQIGMTSTEFVVKVNCAEDLDKKDFNYFNNVYVKVYLGEKKLLGATPIVENSINPIWSTGNEFRIPMKQLLVAEQYLDAQIRFYRASMGLAAASAAAAKNQQSAVNQTAEESANAGDQGNIESGTATVEGGSRPASSGRRRGGLGLGLGLGLGGGPTGLNDQPGIDQNLQQELIQLPDFLSLIRAEVYDRRSLTNDSHIGNAVLHLDQLRKILPDLPSSHLYEVSTADVSFAQDFLLGEEGFLSNPMGYLWRQSSRLIRKLHRLIQGPSASGHGRDGEEEDITMDGEGDEWSQATKHRHLHASQSPHSLQSPHHLSNRRRASRIPQLMNEGEQILPPGEDSEEDSDNDIEAQVIQRRQEELAEPSMLSEPDLEEIVGDQDRDREKEREKEKELKPTRSFSVSLSNMASRLFAKNDTATEKHQTGGRGGDEETGDARGPDHENEQESEGDDDDEDNNEEEEEADDEADDDENEGDEEQGQAATKETKDTKKNKIKKVTQLKTKKETSIATMATIPESKPTAPESAIRPPLLGQSDSGNPSMRMMLPPVSGNQSARGILSPNTGSAPLSRSVSARFKGIAPPQGPPPEDLPDDYSQSPSIGPLSSYSASLAPSRHLSRSTSVRRRVGTGSGGGGLGSDSASLSTAVSVTNRVKALLLNNGKDNTPPPVTWSDIYRLPITRQSRQKGRQVTGQTELLESQEAYGSLVLRLIVSNRGQVTTGVDAAVQRMTLGEKAMVKCRFDQAYGSYGLNSRFPPRSNVIYYIRLLDINGQGRWQLPQRMARRLYRLVAAFFAGVWLALLVLLRLREPPPVKSSKERKRIRQTWSYQIQVLLKLREPLPPDSDEDSEDGESVDSDEDQPWENDDHFHDAQRQYQDEEDDDLQEKEEKFRLGKVDRHMKKHFNPTVKAGAKLLWGVNFKEAPDRRRPKTNPNMTAGMTVLKEEDEEHLPDFDLNEEKENEYEEKDD